jgi:hypothetical protein
MVRFYLVGVIPQIIDRQEMSDWSIFATKKDIAEKGRSAHQKCAIFERRYIIRYISLSPSS